MKKQQVQMQQVIVNPNKTSALTKLLRTLSFVILLAVFTLLQMYFLFDANTDVILLSQIQSLLQPVQDVLTNYSFLQDGFYIASALLLGLLIFIWTVSKSVLLKVILTSVLILSYVVMLSEQVLFIAPETLSVTSPTFLDSVLDIIGPLLQELFALQALVPLLIIFITFALLTLLLAFRKPKRVSLIIVRAGFDIVLLALFVEFLKVVLIDAIIPLNIYEIIKSYSFLIGYDLVILGSIFGILGFFRN
jgi:hypothetical protein